MKVLNVKFGVSLQGRNFTPNFQEMKQIALKADELGFHSIWTSDHLMHPFPVSGKPEFYCHEAWTTLSALGALTKRVKLGFSVLVPAFRRPSVIAKMATTLDILSNGRLILCIGAGWFKKEYDAYDIPWEEHDFRIEREREAALVIKALFTQTSASFDGKYYRLREAVMEPKPVQKPHPPIWIGGDLFKTVNLAAKLADGWFMRPEDPRKLKEKIAVMRRAVGARRFEYATSLKELTLENPSGLLSKIHDYIGAGINLLSLTFHNANDLELFAEKVLPTFGTTE